ncbi:TPA: restriction endonuclease subunit S [Bacillus cereus]
MGAKQLKDSILQYAMRGKLVPQDPNDEPASELLKRIKVEKEELIKQKAIKREKDLPEIIEEEIPFAIPDSWEWERIGNVTIPIMGQSPKGDLVSEIYTEGSIEFHQGKSYFGNDTLDKSNKYVTKPTKLVESKAVLMSVRAPVGDVNIVDRKICVGRGLAALIPHNGIELEYLYFILKIMKPAFERQSTGSTFKAISASVIKEQLVPIPPIKEQERIIKQLTLLMQKQEIYSGLYEKTLQLQNTFPSKLEKSILQYAMQGKLVPQDPNDEPASELLKRIKVEKEELIKQKAIKREKDLPEITEEEIPFAIPDSWEWVRLGDIAYSIDAGKSPQCESRPALLNEWGVIKTTAIQNNVFEADKNKVLPEKFEIKPSYIIEEGNVLITRAGPKNRVGIACYVESLNQKLILSDKTLKINIGNEYIDYMYLSFVLNSPEIRKSIESKMSGMANSQVNISQANLKLICVPIPPIAEQKRIVERINKYREISVNL